MNSSGPMTWALIFFRRALWLSFQAVYVHVKTGIRDVLS